MSSEAHEDHEVGMPESGENLAAFMNVSNIGWRSSPRARNQEEAFISSSKPASSGTCKTSDREIGR